MEGSSHPSHYYFLLYKLRFDILTLNEDDDDDDDGCAGKTVRSLENKCHT